MTIAEFLTELNLDLINEPKDYVSLDMNIIHYLMHIGLVESYTEVDGEDS